MHEVVKDELVQFEHSVMMLLVKCVKLGWLVELVRTFQFELLVLGSCITCRKLIWASLFVMTNFLTLAATNILTCSA